ncbi:MAG: endopeptidase La [Spirochaetia bacterium]|jgi:ATP-dependent Lon protease|nr:endopeptidase La [Spirochaetia bacterium]
MDIDDIMLDGESIDTSLLENELISIDKTMPAKLYIIPIRYRPIFPGIVTPLIISQGRFADAIERVIKESRTIGLVLIKDDEKDEIDTSDLYSYGTAVKIIKKINLPDGGINVLINSVKRFKISTIVSSKKYIVADIEYFDETTTKNNVEVKALTREVLNGLKKIADNNPLFTEEMRLTMLNVDEPGKIADFVTSILNVEKNEYQEVLETLNIKKRLVKVLRLLRKELDVMTVQKKIQGQINDKVDKQQKDLFLREQLKAIKQELGIDDDERFPEITEMKRKIKALGLTGEAKDKAESEMDRFTTMEVNSIEYSVTKNYLDTFISLPWNTRTGDKINLDKTSRILDREHYGLEDIKKRILEFLAIRKLKPDAKGSIICLLGPPGVGKTSLGRSIAKSMNRKFFRISLGGMRDEAEIKGHRRTYVGAMPGKIIQGIKIAGSGNPVFMLDEIDKMGQSFQGDPASALLEVLDPEQNVDFRDHYLDVPFDLSNVLFITTANTLDTVPQVLIDRMEIIRLSGYITEEKYRIAKRYLLPKQISRHGLPANSINIDKEGFVYIIDGWAREAGVRNLERQLEKICRKTATKLARGGRLSKKLLTLKEIKANLGSETYFDEELITPDKPGLTIGLAWTSLGGVTMPVESLGITNKKNPGFKLTGQLGDVMTESANIAYSHINYILGDDDEAAKFFDEHLIHLHVPSGAIPKDGPSAGITMATSLYSLVTGKIVKKSLAMTGELSLTGKVFPIGGVKEKIIAAKRAKMKAVILPEENRKDFAEISDYIYKGIKLHFVKDFNSVLKIAFR